MRVKGDFVEINNDENVVIVKGDAYIEYGEMKLWADSIQGHLKWNEVQAQGNVRFWRNQERIEGHMLVYNYRSRRGRISELRTKRGVNYIKAERMKIEPYQMRAWNVKATTCEQNPPHYYVKAKEMLLYPKDRMILHGVSLVMGGKTRFRFPKYEINMKTGQQANRLYVSPGYSASKGFTLKSAYSFYFSPKVRGRAYFHPSQRGDHKAGVDVHYDPNKHSSGKFSYRNYRSSTLDQSETRINLSHREKFSKTTQMRVNAQMTSLDRSGQAADSELNIDVELKKQLKDWDLTLDFDRRIDLDGDRYSNDNVIQSLDATPRLRFKQRTPHPFFGSHDLSLLLEGSIERIKEQSTEGTTESMKEELLLRFRPKPIKIGDFSRWTWNFRDRISLYSGHENRNVFGLNLSTRENYDKNWSTSMTYSLQRVKGSTPFSTYDLLEDQNRGTWYLRYNRPERLSATVFQTSFDFESGLFSSASSNLVFRNPSSDAIRWSAGFTANYDLGDNRETLSDLKVANLSSNLRIERPKTWRHSLIGNYDVQARRLSSITAMSDFLLTPTIRFQTNTNMSYDPGDSSLDVTRLNVALVKDYHCWEGRLRWDVEQEEAFLEFYLKHAAAKKLSIGVDYQGDLDVDPEIIDGERPGSSFSSF